MAKNVLKAALKMNRMSRVHNDHVGRILGGVIRCYHPDVRKFPGLPLPIHDSDFYMYPEGGQPLNFFVPDMSELDYDELKEVILVRINSSLLNGRKILQRTSEIDLLLISNQAIQTAREVPNKILKNNHFVSSEGIIAVEKMFPLEKLMSSVKDKLSDVTSKISGGREITPQVIKAWENVKEKLPAWQNAIVTKLQEFQDRINKGTAKKEA